MSQLHSCDLEIAYNNRRGNRTPIYLTNCYLSGLQQDYKIVSAGHIERLYTNHKINIIVGYGDDGNG